MLLPPLIFALALGAAQPAPSGPCLDVSDGDADVSLGGRLEQRSYSDPSTMNGRAERAYILVLAAPICLDDGGEFADPRERVDRVHLYTSTETLWPRLRAGVGWQVHIQGSGFAAHTAHHRAPLVVDVRAIRIEGR